VDVALVSLRTLNVQRHHPPTSPQFSQKVDASPQFSHQVDAQHGEKCYRSGGIRGRVVCVIDDYLTTGASMEAARQLLLAAGAKRVVCIVGGFNRQKRRGEFAYTKGTPVARLCLEFDDEDNVQVGTGGDGPDVGTVTEAAHARWDHSRPVLR